MIDESGTAVCKYPDPMSCYHNHLPKINKYLLLFYVFFAAHNPDRAKVAASLAGFARAARDGNREMTAILDTHERNRLPAFPGLSFLM
jgi:hypothetical protein